MLAQGSQGSRGCTASHVQGLGRGLRVDREQRANLQPKHSQTVGEQNPRPVDESSGSVDLRRADSAVEALEFVQSAHHHAGTVRVANPTEHVAEGVQRVAHLARALMPQDAEHDHCSSPDRVVDRLQAGRAPEQLDACSELLEHRGQRVHVGSAELRGGKTRRSGEVVHACEQLGTDLAQRLGRCHPGADTSAGVLHQARNSKLAQLAHRGSDLEEAQSVLAQTFHTALGDALAEPQNVDQPGSQSHHGRRRRRHRDPEPVRMVVHELVENLLADCVLSVPPIGQVSKRSHRDAPVDSSRIRA